MHHLYRASLVALFAVGLGAATAGFDTSHHPAGQAGVDPVGSEALFLAENARAMDTMMADMHVEPTGDIDTDFTAMMIPHHQGAIDMAVAYLRYGDNPQLRRLAQEIVVEQQQEIVAMRLAVGQPLPQPAPAPTHSAPPAMSCDPARPPGMVICSAP